MDKLEDRQKSFFASCKRLKPAERQAEFERIRGEYARAIGDSSEKIASAAEAYNLVDKYLRKLDQELHSFKLELEADNRGITEVLEKRSLEMDQGAGGNAAAGLKENRLPSRRAGGAGTLTPSGGLKRPNQTIAHGLNLGGMTPTAGTSNAHNSKKFLGFGASSDALLDNALPSPSPSSSSSANHVYPLQHMGAGGSAIAAAASQAIAATQQYVPGRRTSSLKASYEAINLGLQTHEFSIGRELAGAAQSALAATSLSPGPGSSLGGSASSSSGPPAKRQKSNKYG